MSLDPQVLAEFRENLRRSREANRDEWESSTRLVGQAALPSTLEQLIQKIRSTSLPSALREALLGCLDEEASSRNRVGSGAKLKALTGLPTTKALRALCVLLRVGTKAAPAGLVSSLDSAEVEDFVRSHQNPYDLLVAADVASLLDLGAGDLSFAVELFEQFLPTLRDQQKDLVLHCVERLKPASKLGTVLHADQTALQRLAHHTPGLRFRFWGGEDMFELEHASGLRPTYTIVTCHAPPTPTFAYEPSRVSRELIDRNLRETKGEYRRVRVEGEDALEVLHGGRSLIFPPWKFEIRGPLALLDLISRRGQLCVLSSVDTDVFWELLAQLVADDRMRPRDLLFTPTTRREVFGDLYTRLSELPVGHAIDLSSLTELRRDIPRTLAQTDGMEPSFRFRYVALRRGAVFEGIPASRTARLFEGMPEEVPPWFLTLVPQD